MKAVRFHDKADIRVEDIAEPKISAPDDVLVAPYYCGICGTDLHEYAVGPIVTPTKPHPLTGVTNPQVLGHEFSALVVEIGSAVRDVKVGDRVSIMPAIVCGRCEECRTGRGHLCRLFACTGLSAETGGIAELAVVKEYQVAVLPDEVSNLAGAVVEPGAVAAYGVDRVGVMGGDFILVTGAGPIGLLSAMYAQALGAGTVVISEPNKQRAAFAKSLDIGPVVDPMLDTWRDELEAITKGSGFDRTIECSGTSAGLAAGIDFTKRSGKIAQTGLHTKPATFDAMKLSEKDLSIVGNWCYRITDWPRIIRLVATGKYPVDKIVSSVIEMDNVVKDGFDVLIDPQGDQMKVLARING
ncbi:MAG: alcohol dehydrogenase catalytic domain-containing protein [Agromyces sp.]